MTLRIVLSFLLFACGVVSNAQNSVHVSVNSGTDALTCGAAGSPCQTIQYAVDSIAISGDIIQIDTGLYSLPAATSAFTPVVKLPQGKSLSFIGSTAGLGTRINGDVTRRGFSYYYSGTNCNTSSANDGISDSLRFFFKDIIIEDCSITEMCGTTSYAYGGGIRLDCDTASTLEVEIIDCVFRNNRSFDVPGTFAGGRSGSGGAVYIYGRSTSASNSGLYSSAHIRNCDFSGNYANHNYNGGHGGAILLRDLDTASVVNSSFCDNYVYSQTADNGDLMHDRNAGGAICFYDMYNATPAHGYAVDSCSFINNSATTNGGANFTFQSEAGAVFLTKGDVLSATNNATLYISNSNFYNNVIETGIEHIDNNGGTIDTTAIGFNAFYTQFEANLGDDTTLCFGDSLLLDAQIAGASYLWSDNSTGPTLLVTDSGSYSVTLTVGSCEVSDTIQVDYQGYPEIDLGEDTTLCPYDSLLLDVYMNNASYNWSTGSNDSAIYASDSGLIWVEVSVNGCASRDSIVLDTVKLSTGVLGNDTTVCPETVFSISAYTEGATYAWGDGSSSSSKIVTEGGEYIVGIQKQGCTVFDTLSVTYVEEITNVIGDDTSACEGETITLEVRQSGLTGISWFDMDNDSVKSFTTSGTYGVTVNDRGCLFSDSIELFFVPLPEVDLGPDTGGCDDVYIVLDAFIENSTYQWNTGYTSPYYPVAKSGTYTVTVTRDGCSAADSVEMTFISTPEVVLPDTVNLCEGREYVLQPANLDAQYQWNTGKNTRTLTVGDSGFYSVTVSINGCVDSGGTRVLVHEYPVFDLGKDTSFCENRPPLLYADYDNAEYLWQDSSRRQDFQVENGGKHWVRVTQNGCVSSDTIRLKKRYLPKIDLGNDTTICLEESFEITLDDENTLYLWNGSNHGNTYIADKEETIEVVGENDCGRVSDQISVNMEQCECSMYVPNAFTPILDGINDEFSISYVCDIVEFEFMVYDRWGHVVFQTNQPDFSWDGINNGQALPIGSYPYTMFYSARMNQKPKPFDFERTGVIHIVK
ncbi:MAG: gliding motility-associated C-terminal domain-containing protein [Salibacteraceae bacterium]